MGLFFDELKVTPDSKRDRCWILLERLRYDSDRLGVIEVHKGFDTDFASIPRVFWNIYPPYGTYTSAAVVHDFLYYYQRNEAEPVTRKQADDVFLEAMETLGVRKSQRLVIYYAVRAFGWIAWSKRRQELDEENN